MSWEQIKADYRRMAKPRAIEEVGDIYLIRPLGFLLVQLFRRTPLTPTMVSVLALLAGWLTAWLYYESSRRGTVAGLAGLGALAFLLHSALDSADGQLARLKNLHTSLGRLIDGLCDNLSFLAIYLAILFGFWARSGGDHLLLAVLTAAAVVSHSIQSSLVEHQRTLYLFCVHAQGEILDTHPERLKKQASTGPISRMLQFLHRVYYREQRFFVPSTARLERSLAEWLKRHPERRADLAALYEESYRRRLPFWALLASNSHKIGIIVAAFIPVSDQTFWSRLGSGWYLMYDLSLNAAAFLLVAAQGKVDRAFLARLESLAD